MPSYTKSTYEYTKLRRNFGRQPLFQIVPAHILDSIYPNKEDQKQYALRNPVHREVLATMPQSENETNTKQLITHEQGINHTEGGWPREVHLYNEDHVLRHRRRIMHDDNYIHTVQSLAPAVEHYLDQNNAIEMYQTYFADMRPQEPVEKYSVRIANVFCDPFRRPISCVVWTHETNSKIAVAYKPNIQNPESDITYDFYVWDISRQTEPIHELKPQKPCWEIACSPINSELFITGLENGTVNVFDIRESKEAVASSSVYNSHRGPITSVLYSHSRTNTEFFTGSPDGQCFWWDSRNLSDPLHQITMSIKLLPGEEPTLGNAEGVSALEFDHGFPTKFLCGTESGLVINVNRLGRSHSETLTSYWNAHSGPVRAVQRSPCTSRMFLTCGDWSVRLWSEEVRTAPIIVTRPYRHQVTDAVWAPLRYSSYMAVCADGCFYYWDMLRKYREPAATLQVSKHELTRITPHAEGQLIGIGDSDGALHLLQLSENMTVPGSHDKVLMFQTYERETRREHILDNRLKEIRLKIKAEEEPITDLESVVSVDQEELDKATEEQYFNIVNEELRKITPSDISII